MSMSGFEVGGQSIGLGRFFVIGGPCVIESEALVMRVAGFLKDVCAALDISCIL
jgi:2-dehydro-3-deoxyphosphooctonate aldolase (KDO 8-P synthase)